jgi:16S rRNA (cytosine967-C5)-methyltransferase
VAYDLATRAARGSDDFDEIWHVDPALSQLSQRDKALAIHLAAGVLRRMRRLDAQARFLTDGKSDDLKEPLKWILRFGLFQVVDCDRIPPHAAVSTAVDAAKAVAHQGIAGLVNAVLRRAAREKDQLRAQEQAAMLQGGADTAAWGERLSMPDWLVELLFARYGQDKAERIDRWANSPPSYFFRLGKNVSVEAVAKLIADQEMGVARQHPEFQEYVTVPTSALALGSPLFSGSYGWVQNPAAGLVVKLLDPQDGDTVIDLFSAPGGKALAIAEHVGPTGQVLAVDKNEKRLQRVIDNKVRMGFEQIMPIVGDVANLGPREAMRVLADVPCSALGTLPKNPEVRWTKTPADIARLARSQRIWLSAASTHVAAGGVLVYSTCTLPRPENEEVVGAFLADHPGFALERAEEWVNKRYVTSDGYLSTRPPDDGLDGVFAARLRRSAS